MSDLIRTRRSVRAFEDREIPQEVLTAILDDAKWAPSWCNTHPYFVCIARGERKNRIRDQLCQKYDAATQAANAGIIGKLGLLMSGGAPDGDYDVLLKYPPSLQKHRVACAKGLYGLMEISREDKAAREKQDKRNFEFFDAPCVMFIFVQGDMGPYSPLDAGFYLNTLMLSAHARGLGTCAQGSLAMWGSPVRAEFPEIPAGYNLLCGLSLGYAKADAKINSYNPGRADVECAGL
jgi:nitroreductase